MKKNIKSNKNKMFFEQINKLANIMVLDNKMKELILQFVMQEFSKEECEFTKVELIQYRIAWILLVVLFRDIDITVIDWQYLCIVYNLDLFHKVKQVVECLQAIEVEKDIMRILKNEKLRIGWTCFYSLTNEFYFFLSKSEEAIGHENIKKIREYEHLLIETPRS